MSKESVSAVIITKNEEEKIRYCLESIKWVDEIVIVDDLSTDRTVEICQEYGAKIISHKSEGNFDRQRNIGIDNASSEWIFQLDADEIVPEALKKEIQELLAQSVEFSAYQICRKNFFLGHFMRYGGFYGQHWIKLFKKSAARYIGRSVHETLEVQGKLGTIKADIEHYPFQSFSQQIARMNMYSSVEAKIMAEENTTPDIKKIRYNLTIKPLKRFWKMYIKKKGYKDGMYGLIFAILFTFGPMLRFMKYWEITKDKTENA